MSNANMLPVPCRALRERQYAPSPILALSGIVKTFPGCVPSMRRASRSIRVR